MDLFVWLLSFFIGYLPPPDLPPLKNEYALVIDAEIAQQAGLTVTYLNVINDWRYNNPAVPDGSISNHLLHWPDVKGIENVISGGRTFVYQKNRPGLMAALLAKSRYSALIGHVIERRLIDSTGKDMSITVPDVIPDGYIVYVN